MSAVQANVSKYMSLADGTLRVQLDIHQTDTKAALELLCEVGRTVAVAALQDSVDEPENRTSYSENECDNNAGKLMQALYTCGWFNAPPVLKALGEDSEFLDWLTQLSCWACGKWDEGEHQVVAAHYRRVKDGAGTAIKPPFSAIPLCSRCHAKQHQHGYSVLGTKDWWEEKVARARQEWGHVRMRAIFETESMRAVQAKWVVEWALEHELGPYLPREYLA